MRGLVSLAQLAALVVVDGIVVAKKLERPYWTYNLQHVDMFEVALAISSWRTTCF